MNEMRKKISRIVDELMIFQFNNGAEDIQINVRKQKDEGCDNAELQLIGQMVDQAEARLEGDKLSIRLFRRFER